MFSYWAKPQHGLDVARWLNDHVAGVVRDNPQRFRALATLPMQDPDAACRELERCVRDLGLPGVQIGTNINGKNLNEPEVVQVLTECERLGACVFVHPWEMVMLSRHPTTTTHAALSERMNKYWLPWLVGMPAETCLAICSVLFGGVLEQLPRLRLCFAHGGGSFPGTIGRIQHGFDCRPDLVAVDSKIPPRDAIARRSVMPAGSCGGEGCSGESIGNLERPAKFYVDSLVHDADALRLIVKQFGARRVALGSDFPFPLGEDRPGALVESMAKELGTDIVQQILGLTAMEFLGASAPVSST
jgi:aminocarboxymuconate-semialdehyde decarboxylase